MFIDPGTSSGQISLHQSDVITDLINMKHSIDDEEEEFITACCLRGSFLGPTNKAFPHGSADQTTPTGKFDFLSSSPGIDSTHSVMPSGSITHVSITSGLRTPLWLHDQPSTTASCWSPPAESHTPPSSSSWPERGHTSGASAADEENIILQQLMRISGSSPHVELEESLLGIHPPTTCRVSVPPHTTSGSHNAARLTSEGTGGDEHQDPDQYSETDQQAGLGVGKLTRDECFGSGCGRRGLHTSLVHVCPDPRLEHCEALMRIEDLLHGHSDTAPADSPAADSPGKMGPVAQCIKEIWGSSLG